MADFRTRAAEQKRERMRARLLAATLDLFQLAEKKTVVIDDVVRQAGVARGTFYKYFDSLEVAVAELGQRMADEMIATYTRIFDEVDDEEVRAVAGSVMTLARAAMDPRWGAFTSSVDYVAYFAQSHPLEATVAGSLERARHAAVFRFSSLSAAIDLMVGAAVEGARRLAGEPSHGAAYARELSAMSAAALGMPPPIAEAATRRAWDFLENAASTLPWWRSLPELAAPPA